MDDFALVSSVDTRKEMIDTILDPGDEIHITNVDQLSYTYDYQRSVDYNPTVSTPWTYEFWGTEEMASMKKNQPKAVFYSSGIRTWGYNLDQYGADLVKYIRENYTRYENTDLWIRNDYMPEALERLNAANAG